MEGDETSGWRPGKPTVFLNSRFHERAGMFSPDGRWLAYASNESGRFEVCVRPLPGPGGNWQISTGDGGSLTPTPTWSRTRHELFYDTPDKRIIVASYMVEGDSFRADKPRLWSEARFITRPDNGLSTCTRMATGSRSRRSRRHRQSRKTRSSSSSTSSTSSGGSRLQLSDGARLTAQGSANGKDRRANMAVLGLQGNSAQGVVFRTVPEP